MMYATKLMMQGGGMGTIPPYQEPEQTKTYIEDGLIKKVENSAFGTNILIQNIVNGLNAFTYCGTVPFLLNKTVISVIPYTLDIFLYSNNKITWRNVRTNGGVIPAADRPIIEDNGIQPYIAVTLRFPTTSSQEVSFDYEGIKINTSVVSVSYGNYDYASVAVGTSKEVIDLGLVYNRVLSPDELAHNYQAFLANHR